MSFRINNNISAMTALRNVGNTNIEAQRSITRLSTGLRINSGADDPAGLIISETFRAQIGGLEQAIRNNQDAINFGKTAEGALAEISKLLKDARALAVTGANSATLSEAQVQANQQQLNSIAESITRISEQTQFGSKKLLDGSAGVVASSVSATNINYVSFTGTFNGQAITADSAVTMNVTTDAERATLTGTRTFALATTVMSAAGSFSINGRTFSVTTADTISDVVGRINQASEVTGVTAAWAAGGGVVLTSKEYGSAAEVNLNDASGILLSAAGATTDAGVNAVADVSVTVNGSAATVTFNQGSGLNLKDQYGNTITLTENGNLTSTALTVAQLNVGRTQFQIGANAGQTAGLNIANFAASELGKGVVSGLTLANLDITGGTSATQAMQVIDKAIEEVSAARGNIGNFIRNTLESQVRNLGVAKENLTASESAVRDADIADEMTNFTKLQILQQSGMAMLAQANSSPNAVLSLLRG
ncbi:MAG: flagellin [Chthonomonas sp.]